MALAARLERHWYGDTWLSRLLAPVGWVYCALVALRRLAYRRGWRRRQRMPVPVIVVGNLTVGGTGKTPLVVWLAHWLRQSGYRPGIIARGYGGAARVWPQVVDADSDPRAVGDEPVLIARRADCPVVADPDRPRAAARLLNQYACDVIVSDDGLQHLRLVRDIEILLIDGARRFGNGRCLPAGPLRESAKRAREVDVCLVHGATANLEWRLQLMPAGFRAVGSSSGSPVAAEYFAGTQVHAVAGIGVPERFFATLESLGLNIIRHPFPDHHAFQRRELLFGDQRPVIMTEKDAVKCEKFLSADQGYWYLAVQAQPDARLGPWLTRRLAEVARG